MKKTIAVFIALLGTSSAFAQSLSDALSTCRAESNSLKRLVCYDKLAKSLDQYTDMDISAIRSQSRSQEQFSVSQPTTTPSTATSAASEFGMEHKQQANNQLEKLHASITSIKKDPYDKLIITLDNGQVWKQVESMRINLKKGNRIYLERGMFDSFFIGKEEGNKKTRVKRVK